jgi:hypothetical protein
MDRLPTRVAWLIAVGLTALAPAADAQDRAPASGGGPLIRGDQRVVIAMVDGFGTDYLDASEMPVLKGLMARFTRPRFP